MHFDVSTNTYSSVLLTPVASGQEPFATMGRDVFLTLYQLNVELYRKRRDLAREAFDRISDSFIELGKRLSSEVSEARQALVDEYKDAVEAEIEVYNKRPRSWWARLWMKKDPDKVRELAEMRLFARGIRDPKAVSFDPLSATSTSRFIEARREIRDRLYKEWCQENMLSEDQKRFYFFSISPITLYSEAYDIGDFAHVAGDRSVIEDFQWEALSKLTDELTSFDDFRTTHGVTVILSEKEVDTVSVPTRILNPPPIETLFTDWIGEKNAHLEAS